MVCCGGTGCLCGGRLAAADGPCCSTSALLPWPKGLSQVAGHGVCMYVLCAAVRCAPPRPCCWLPARCVWLQGHGVSAAIHPVAGCACTAPVCLHCSADVGAFCLHRHVVIECAAEALRACCCRPCLHSMGCLGVAAGGVCVCSLQVSKAMGASGTRCQCACRCC